MDACKPPVRTHPASSGSGVNAGWCTVAAVVIRESLVPVSSAINTSRVHSAQAQEQWRRVEDACWTHLRVSRPARVSWMHHGHAIRRHICSRSRSHVFSRLPARLSGSGAVANRCSKTCMERPLRDDPAAAAIVRTIPIGARATRRAHPTAMHTGLRTLEPGHRLIGASGLSGSANAPLPCCSIPSAACATHHGRTVRAVGRDIATLMGCKWRSQRSADIPNAERAGIIHDVSPCDCVCVQKNPGKLTGNL